MDPLDPCQLVWDTALALKLKPRGDVWHFAFNCPILEGDTAMCLEGVDGRAVLSCNGHCSPDDMALALGLKAHQLTLPRGAKLVKASPTEATRQVAIVNAATIKPRRTEFLWYPYLPLGKVVIVAGAPGHGKSQLAALIAALSSRGALPGDVNQPSRSLMMCAEDDLSDTVVPRLMAVNADLRLVDFINVRTTHPGGLTSTGMIRLPGDVDPVHEWASSSAGARLVVMDPVASFFERGHSTLVNQDVRDAFDPMVAIAQTYGITIVIILHLNKSESRDFMTRIAESHGFQALARSVLALGPHPRDPEGQRGSQKVIAVTKANLVKPGTYGMHCEVRSTTLRHLTPPIETSELVLLGKCEITADDLLTPSAEQADRNAKLTWLDEFLDGQWRKTKVVKDAASSDGWTWKQIDELARKNHYARQKVGFQGEWWIGPPEADPRAIPGNIGSKDSLESFDGSKNPEDHKEPGFPGIAREDINGRRDLDAYREWEQRRLGERDEEDDE